MLEPNDIEALADALAPRVADLVIARLRAVPDERVLLDATELAPLIGFEPEWIRDHAEELGAFRIGDGPRPRLKFDLETALSYLRRNQAAPAQPRRLTVVGEPAVRPRRPRRGAA